MTQTTFPAFSPLCSFLNFFSLSNHILHSCLVLGTPTLLCTERSPSPLSSPSTWVLFALQSLTQFLPPSYRTLAGHSSLVISLRTELFDCIFYPSSTSHVWFLLLVMFLCAHILLVSLGCQWSGGKDCALWFPQGGFSEVFLTHGLIESKSRIFGKLSACQSCNSLPNSSAERYPDRISFILIEG